MHALDELDAAARLQTWTAKPALSADAFTDIAAAVDKLLQQFAREERVQQWALTSEADGTLLVLAHSGVLSGCAQDRLARLIGQLGERQGVDLLAAPPICVLHDGRWTTVTRGELRSMVAVGRIHADTTVCNRYATQLSEWRAAPTLRLSDSPFARVLQ